MGIGTGRTFAAENVRPFFDTLSNVIAVVNREGRVRFANRALLDTLAYGKQEVDAMRMADLLPADRWSEVQTAFAAAENGEPSDCALPLVRKDGTLLPAEAHISSAKWESEDCVLYVARTRPSEQEAVKLSKALEFEREVTRLATQFVNVPVEQQDVAINESLATMGQLVDVDRTYLYTYDFDRRITTNTHEWCSPGVNPEIWSMQMVKIDDFGEFPEWLAAHVRGESFRVPSVSSLPVDNALRDVLESQGVRSMISQPLMHLGKCLGFVGLDAVRSERMWQPEEERLLQVMAEVYAHFEARRSRERETRELQERLTAARDAADAAARAKSLFLANMTHEIRTPLNAILGYAQIMERECRACPMKHRLGGITRSGDRLLGLIGDLLELVRTEGGNIRLSPTTFSLHQLLSDLRLMFAQRAASQKLSLQVSLASDVPRFIRADQGKLLQVLINLVGNSVKFTRQGGVQVSAFILSAPGEDMTIAVDVEDTGCGIPADELESIFDLFFVSKSAANAGTGLGLPLSRRYARAMGGDVTVTSCVGIGTRFQFTFTAQRAQQMTLHPPTFGSDEQLVPAGGICRILVVDDDDASRDMLAGMLQPVGFEVETAASAAEALERLLDDVGIGLVLMDKRMPEMDGYEAIARIRRLTPSRRLPVLVVSASGLGDESTKALDADADGFVSKPVQRAQLLSEIARVTGVSYGHQYAAGGAAGDASAVSRDALARLSTDRRRVLGDALRRGDIGQMREVVEAIAGEDRLLAAGIKALVDSYDYDRLRTLLDPGNGGSR